MGLTKLEKVIGMVYMHQIGTTLSWVLGRDAKAQGGNKTKKPPKNISL